MKPLPGEHRISRSTGLAYTAPHPIIELRDGLQFHRSPHVGTGVVVEEHFTAAASNGRIVYVQQRIAGSFQDARAA